MTRSSFRDLCKVFVRTDGQPYVSADAEWNTLINDGLAILSFQTLLCFDSTIDLITSGGSKTWLYGTPPVYDLMDTGLYNTDSQGYARRIILPMNVILGDRPLRDLKGKMGPISFDEMQSIDVYGTAKTNTSGDVRYWCREHPYKIRIFPCPDTNFNTPSTVTGVIPGFYLHPALTNDAHTLYIADHHTRMAAAFTAALALDPRAQGTSLEKMQRLDQAAAAEFAQLKAMADQTFQRHLGFVPEAPQEVAA